MIVHLDAGAVVVGEPNDCTRLHVSTALDPSAVDEALRCSDTGHLREDGTALLVLDTLRARARAAVESPDWDDRWQAMVGYAAAKGWLSPDRTHVEAHVEFAH